MKTGVMFSFKIGLHSLHKINLHGVRIYYCKRFNSVINKLIYIKFDIWGLSSICQTNALVILTRFGPTKLLLALNLKTSVIIFLNRRHILQKYFDGIVYSINTYIY